MKNFLIPVLVFSVISLNANSQKTAPENVKKEFAKKYTLNTDFKGYKKNLIEIYESPEIKDFELELKKGESSLEVIFDNNGKVFKKTDEKEEDEKDEKAEKPKKLINSKVCEPVLVKNFYLFALSFEIEFQLQLLNGS